MILDRTIRFALPTFVCACLLLLGPAAAQDGWVVPDDYVPPAGTPTVLPIPLAVQGPINFDEAEFPTGTDMSSYAVTTLNGAPLPGTLSFSSPSSDISVGVGPGILSFVAAPVVRSRDLGTTFSIDFGVDISRVIYTYAINCGVPEMVQSTVAAFDSANNFVGTTSVAGADQGSFFLEGQVDFNPSAAFRRIDVTFSATPGCDRFAFDRLQYDDAVPAPAMPMPWLIALAIALVAAGAGIARRRTA